MVPRASALPDSAFACSEVQNRPGSRLQALGLKLPAQDSYGLGAALTAVNWATSFLVFGLGLIKM